MVACELGLLSIATSTFICLAYPFFRGQPSSTLTASMFHFHTLTAFGKVECFFVNVVNRFGISFYTSCWCKLLLSLSNLKELR